MKIKNLFATLASAAFTTVSAAHAAVISVDINGQSGSLEASVISTVGDHKEADLNVAGNAGDQIGVWEGSGATNFWNYTNFTETGSTAASSLVDADGNVTSVGFTVAGDGRASNWGGGSPDDDLVNDGIFANSGASITLTITGLAAGNSYDLLYYTADNFPATSVSANGVSPIAYTGTIANAGYADVNDFFYLEGVIANGSGEIVVTGTNPGGFSTLTGFQIVPEPSVALLGGLGGLLLLRRRRC